MLKIKSNLGAGESIIKHIVNSRFRQKKNTFFAICGGSGEGKSMVALRLAEIIDPNFNPTEQVIYIPTQFLEIIKIAKEKNYKVVILDEAQTTVNNRQWFSFTNMAISFVASTFRQLKNLVIIIVTPNINWVEKTIREMVNYYGVVFRYEGSPAYLKLYEVGFNYFDLRDQSPFLKRITFNMNKRMWKINVIEVGLPSQKNIALYESLSTKYKSELLGKQLAELIRRMEKDTKAEMKSMDEIVSILINNPKLLKRVTKNSKLGFKLRKTDIKSLFKLEDEKIFELESMIEDKLKEVNLI